MSKTATQALTPMQQLRAFGLAECFLADIALCTPVPALQQSFLREALIRCISENESVFLPPDSLFEFPTVSTDAVLSRPLCTS